MRTLFLALVLTLAVAVPVGAAVLKQQAKNGEIAFSARVHGISQVFTINPDGTRLRQVTHQAVLPAGQFGLSWSPDGRSLVYSVTGKIDSIVKIHADGRGGATAISPPCTGTCLGDDDPAYSPDGKKIAFERAFGPVVNNYAALVAIFTMKADGSQLTQLTNKTAPTSGEDYQPVWSPDGTKIAFVHSNTTATPKSAIDVMNTDGSNVRRLTPFGVETGNPHWSPDGKRLLFNTGGGQGVSTNLFTMRADGTNRVRLTHYVGGSLTAQADAWSPDGRQILFRRLLLSGTDTEVGGFYIMNLGTKRIRRVTPVRIRSDARSAWGKRPG
jgi:Tol biopolymer transport system component